MEPGGHGVELIAERLKFVTGIDYNTLLKVAAADAHSANLQCANRDDHSPCQ